MAAKKNEKKQEFQQPNYHCHSPNLKPMMMNSQLNYCQNYNHNIGFLPNQKVPHQRYGTHLIQEPNLMNNTTSSNAPNQWKEKQEMWNGNKVGDEIPYEASNNIWEKKPNSYLIFKDLLKRCTTHQEMSSQQGKGSRGSGSSCKSNHQRTEDFGAASDDTLSLSLSLNTSQPMPLMQVTKAGTCLDVNDSSLNLTLASKFSPYNH